jgi:hypothetical protein
VFRALIASTIFAASAGAAAAVLAQPSDALVATAPWWEKLVVTVGGGGEPDCVYQSSLSPGSSKACGVEGDGLAEAPSGDSGTATAITFERRFTPGPSPDLTVNAGDTLLSKSVIALAIDKQGKVAGCKVMATSGDSAPNYGCAEARAERFKTSAAEEKGGAFQVATMTILVYAHEEHYA